MHMSVRYSRARSIFDKNLPVSDVLNRLANRWIGICFPNFPPFEGKIRFVPIPLYHKLSIQSFEINFIPLPDTIVFNVARYVTDIIASEKKVG